MDFMDWVGIIAMTLFAFFLPVAVLVETAGKSFSITIGIVMAVATFVAMRWVFKHSNDDDRY